VAGFTGRWVEGSSGGSRRGTTSLVTGSAGRKWRGPLVIRGGRRFYSFLVNRKAATTPDVRGATYLVAGCTGHGMEGSSGGSRRGTVSHSTGSAGLEWRGPLVIRGAANFYSFYDKLKSCDYA